jgi:hypothetical protein
MRSSTPDAQPAQVPAGQAAAGAPAAGNARLTALGRARRFVLAAALVAGAVLAQGCGVPAADYLDLFPPHNPGAGGS